MRPKPVLSFVRARAPDAVKDWLLARRKLSDRESMRVYRRLRRLRRRVRSGLVPPEERSDASGLVSIRPKALRGEPFFLRPGSTDVDVVWKVLIRGRGAAPPPEVVSPRTIVDLGANIGAIMACVATRFPSARIVGVEVDPANAAICRRNIARWDEQCVLVEAAVWGQDEEVAYVRFPGYEWSTQIGGPNFLPEGQSQTRGLSLNTLMGELDIDWIDYMNIDIEGAERSVLAGESAWAQRVGCMTVQAHGSLDECIFRLAELGFQVVRVDTRSATPVVTAIRPEAKIGKPAHLASR